MLSQLPPEEESKLLIECYYRYIAWNTTPILEQELERFFNEIFRSDFRKPTNLDIAFQDLALVYAVLALGTLANMELAPNDPQAQQLYLLGQQCLFEGRFLVVNTLTAVQALVYFCPSLLPFSS
jgi:hypothetical protein